MHADSDNLNGRLRALEYLHPKKIDLDLHRIERVLATLGHPEKSLPPSVHIAGTNGKGSTLAFIRAMAEAEGLRVHTYTSPHLVSFRERIVLGSTMVSEDKLIAALDRVLTANADQPLSFFEATTAAAFLLFSENPADLLLLETGLGGRYDATNVIDRPALEIITPIDYDHAEFLGRDLAGIAREKAGIFKRYVPILSGRQLDIVRAVLSREGASQGVTPKFLGEDFQTYAQQGRLIFQDENTLLDLPLPALRGQHQIDNAGLAIAAARALQISDGAIAKGLETAQWPARLQPITSGPLFEKADQHGAELWLDGGHNPHAAAALASAMAELDMVQPRPLILIIGILANKDAAGYLDKFTSLVREIIVVPIEGHAALSAENMMDMAQGRNIKARQAESVDQALDMALSAPADPDETPPRILIAGSLYLAGTVLAMDAPQTA